MAGKSLKAKEGTRDIPLLGFFRTCKRNCSVGLRTLVSIASSRAQRFATNLVEILRGRLSAERYEAKRRCKRSFPTNPASAQACRQLRLRHLGSVLSFRIALLLVRHCKIAELYRGGDSTVIAANTKPRHTARTLLLLSSTT